ncbi:MAG TPA: hypothetical protein VFX50_11020, partial [Gemmatimonadales bacterium]|nr:hypothetical protein [Gemmatimonadales bacterium]
MYATCTFCYQSLGSNAHLECFPVARRVAFDPAKGCLWAICPHCARWNLAPMEERWDATDECERRFRRTALRYSSGNVGLAWIADDLELIRIGAALRPEVAAWRYGRVLQRPRPLGLRLAEGGAHLLTRLAVAATPKRARGSGDARAAASRMMAALRGERVLDLVQLTAPQGMSPDQLASEGHEAALDRPLAVVRYRHLLGATLVRPESGQPWALHLPHDHGVLAVEGEAGVRLAARLLSVVNGSEGGGGISRELLEQAVRKVDESARADSYFNRILAIALRTHWGRAEAAEDEATDIRAALPPHEAQAALEAWTPLASQTQRLAFSLTGRTFWGQGGIGSEPRTALLDVPLVDRLALEMAAHEESERRALEG